MSFSSAHRSSSRICSGGTAPAASGLRSTGNETEVADEAAEVALRGGVEARGAAESCARAPPTTSATANMFRNMTPKQKRTAKLRVDAILGSNLQITSQKLRITFPPAPGTRP